MHMKQMISTLIIHTLILIPRVHNTDCIFSQKNSCQVLQSIDDMMTLQIDYYKPPTALGIFNNSWLSQNF